MEVTERKLIKKLSEVMQQVKYIQKRGKNQFHKYTYATESDVAEKVREELAERFVMMIPNVVESSMREHKNRSGNTEYIIKVRMEFKFIDGETGEEITFHTEGEGQDAGDKAMYKAMTGAQKYALMKAFMIPTGDDPEADNTVDERNEKANKQQQDKPKKEDKPKNQNKTQTPSEKAKEEHDNKITPEQVGEIKTMAIKIAMIAKTEEKDVYVKVFNKPDASIRNVINLTKDQGNRLFAKMTEMLVEVEQSA